MRKNKGEQKSAIFFFFKGGKKIFTVSVQNRSITRKGSQRGREDNVKELDKNTRGNLKVQEKLCLIINIKDISVPSIFQQIVAEFYDSEDVFRQLLGKKKERKKERQKERKKERKKEKENVTVQRKAGKFKVQQKNTLHRLL